MLYKSSTTSAVRTLDPLIITPERIENPFPSFSLSPVSTKNSPVSTVELRLRTRPSRTFTTMTKEELPQTAAVIRSQSPLVKTEVIPPHRPQVRTEEPTTLKNPAYWTPHYWTDIVVDDDEDDAVRSDKTTEVQQTRSALDLLINFAGRMLIRWLLGAEKHVQATEYVGVLPSSTL